MKKSLAVFALAAFAALGANCARSSAMAADFSAAGVGFLIAIVLVSLFWFVNDRGFLPRPPRYWARKCV